MSTSYINGASGGGSSDSTTISGGDGITVSGTAPDFTISSDLAPITSADGSVVITNTNPGIDLSANGGISDPVTITSSGHGEVTGTHPNFDVNFWDPTIINSSDNSITITSTTSANNGKIYDLSAGASSIDITSIDSRIEVTEDSPGNFIVEFTPQFMKAEFDQTSNFVFAGPDPTNIFQDAMGTSDSFNGLVFLQDPDPLKNLRIQNTTTAAPILRSRLFMQIRNSADNDRFQEIGLMITTSSGSSFKRDPTTFFIGRSSGPYTSIYYECVFGLGAGATVFPYIVRSGFGLTIDIENIRWIVE